MTITKGMPVVARRDFRVAILGGRGGGQVLAESILRLRAARGALELMGFLNDGLPRGSTELGPPILGPFLSWPDLPDDVLFVAPLHKAKEMPRRARRIRELGIPDDRWASIVDPLAVMASTVRAGRGTYVDALAKVHPAVVLGSHVAVRGGALIGHDTVVGDFSFVGANAFIGGYARIEEGAHIGPGACVLDSLSVGQYAVIGMGSVVVRDVPAGAIMAGNPARRIGTIEP